MSYEGLHFKFADLSRELISMRALAKPLLERDSHDKGFGACISTLGNIKNSRTTSIQVWEVLDEEKESRTIQTIENGGEHDRSDSARLFGRLSFKWEITKRERKDNSKFVLENLASTSVSIYRITDDGNRCVARWQFDISSKSSPGCHFHCQIPFHKPPYGLDYSLPIPRLPTLFITPMDALDFLLGELFPMSWKKELGTKNTNERQMWNGQAGRRMKKLLDWQIKSIEGSLGSPWISIRDATPAPDEFLK